MSFDLVEALPALLVGIALIAVTLLGVAGAIGAGLSRSRGKPNGSAPKEGTPAPSSSSDEPKKNEKKESKSWKLNHQWVGLVLLLGFIALGWAMGWLPEIWEFLTNNWLLVALLAILYIVGQVLGKWTLRVLAISAAIVAVIIAVLGFDRSERALDEFRSSVDRKLDGEPVVVAPNAVAQLPRYLGQRVSVRPGGEEPIPKLYRCFTKSSNPAGFTLTDRVVDKQEVLVVTNRSSTAGTVNVYQFPIQEGGKCSTTGAWIQKTVGWRVK